MGWNTGVLLLNDALHEIKENPAAFANNLLRAIDDFGYVKRPTVDFVVGRHGNGGTVFHKAHADSLGVYAIGGNCTTQLLSSGMRGDYHRTEDDQVAILVSLAAKHGYKLVKKGRPKDTVRP